MTRKRKGWAMLCVLLALLACTPPLAKVQSTPVPEPTVLPPAGPVASPKPENVDWSRVVEAAKKEGRVTIYGFTFIGDLNPAVTDAFYEKYGIKANIIAGPGSVLSERIRTEKRTGTAIADVMEGSATFASVLLQEGLLVPLAKQLPVLNEDAWLVQPSMDEGGNILRGYPSLQSPWINTDNIKVGETPKLWTDLLKPSWVGKLLIIDPRTGTSADRSVYGLTRHKIVDGDFFTKLANQKLIIPAGIGARPPWTALAKGEGAMLLFGSDAQGAPVLNEGAHIRPVVLSGSVVAAGSVFQLVKNGPHPNAGRLFINFALSQQGYELVARMNLLGSLRKDVLDHSVMGSLKPFNIIASTIDDETQIAKNYENKVAAKALKIQ